MSSEMKKSDDGSGYDGRVIESMVIRGDLSGLAPKDRARHYVAMCEQLGLNPASQPFAYLRLNGKEILYATRGATDQLAAIHRVNREIIDGPKVIDISGTKVAYCVARATHPNGRFETATATLPVQDPANLYMKLETKAKRRATLSILGLGLLDETELETIPASVQEPGGGVDLATLDAPALPAPSTWADDLATCDALGEVRACYQSAASPDTDTRALCDDVRAWCSDRGIHAIDAEVAAILATLPAAALVVLDDIHADEEREPCDRIIQVARVVAKARIEWDQHSADTTARIVARSYAHAAGLDLRSAGAALKRALADDAVPDAQADEVSAEVRAHIATKKALPALRNSARKHAAEVNASPALLDVYAAQLLAIEPRDPQDDRTDGERMEPAREAVRGWLAEGTAQ